MQEDTFRMLTTTCGTPGYMAPEIYLRAPYGKGVRLARSFLSLSGCVSQLTAFSG